MNTKKPNAELVSKQFEDLLAPRPHLSPTERAVYSHLSGIPAWKGSPAFVFL